MRSFIAPLVLSFAIATSATEQCDLVSDVVQVLHTVPYASELCSTLLQISTATTTSIATATITETRSITTTETTTETETITDTETTVTGTTTSTADPVPVTSTEIVTIQACRPTVTLKKRSTALDIASASKTCTRNVSSSTTDAYSTQPPSAVKTSTRSTSATTCSSSTPGSYKTMSSYLAVSSTFEYRYPVASSFVRPYYAVTSSIIQKYPGVNSSIYRPYHAVNSTTMTTSSVELSAPTPLVLCAEAPAEMQRYECARITQGCACLSLESSTITETAYSSVTVVEQSMTTSMAYITTTTTVTSTQSIDATEQYTPITTIFAVVTETAPAPDFNNDQNNCGACGNVCPDDSTCSLGRCANRNPIPTQAVVNPSFEDPSTAPWVLFPGGYQIVNTGDHQYGMKTPRILRTQGLFASIRQIPTILPGVYRVQFSVKVEGPDPSKCFIHLTGIAENDYGRATNSDWNTYSYTLTSAGSNNQFIRIVVACDVTPQSGYVYFDNITVNPIS